MYKTREKGWAVRSWDPIPCGAVVCEYVGEVHRDDDSFLEDDDCYLVSIDTVDAARSKVGGGTLKAPAFKC